MRNVRINPIEQWGFAMIDWLNNLLAHSYNFMPHGMCYLWLPSLLWLHVASDLVIAVAYYSIPFALWYFVKKREDLAYRWVFVLFGVFILLCGTTHLMSIWTIWHPSYWLDGIIKMITAGISIITAILIWPLIPKLLLLPSPDELKRSEAYMRAIFDATPDTMLISNEDGMITMVNREAERLLGFTDNELLGQPIEFLVPERFRDAHPALRQQYMSAPFSRTMGAGRIVTTLNKNGKEIDVSISLSPIKTDRGMFFASALRDVTEQKLAEAALVASEERFRRMADASPAMIWITDIEGNPTFVNQTWLNFTGKDASVIKDKEAWFELIYPDDRHDVFDKYYKNILDQTPITTEYRIRRADGEWRWILDQGVPTHDKNGEFSGYIGSAIDITNHKQAEADFRIAATAFDSQEAMVITDRETVIMRVNKAFCDSTGYSAEEAVGQKMNILKSDRHDQAFYTEMWKSINETGTWQGEIWDRRKSGEIYPKWLTITAVKDSTDTITHFVGTHIDISERKAAEEEIKHLAFFDPLTKLPNRRLLRDRLHLSLANCERNEMFNAMLFIDLDNFKMLNDTMGHDKGDLLLIQVANRLTATVRECDTVARLGGDEFVVILNELGRQISEAAIHAEVIAHKLLTILNQPYDIDHQQHHSTPSIGAALFNGKDTTIDSIIKQADIAMYQAKAAGRNTVRFFDSAMQAALNKRANMEEDLHKALLERQFILFFQPQVNSKNVVTGAEALIRWQHPKHGMINPGEFIALAEEIGLILPIGDWVMETACKQLACWSNLPERAHLTLSVNISVAQFGQPNFVEKVLALFTRFGINSKKLKLEITESILALDIEDIRGKMNELIKHGISFSLDDFGTGYSSLSYLKKMPLAQLKIDQSFVRDIIGDENDAAICKMIIALANSMNLEVIAEGVESVEQREFLAKDGCRHFQGYLFGRPAPIEEFETMLTGGIVPDR